MINDFYLNLNEELIKEYKKINFEKDNDNNIYLFLKKYINYIESDNECYFRYLTFKNPLSKNKNFSMINFNNQIETFLEQSLKNSKGNDEKKSKEGKTTCYLGIAYEYGLFNKPKNFNVAHYYYTISAQLNNDYGTFKLAASYEKGLGTPINYEKSIYFYRCSAKLGSPDGMHVYGSILYNGLLNSNKNLDLGKHYLTLSALKFQEIYPYSLYDVGKLYENDKNNKNINTDNLYALEIYKKGLQLNDPNCIFRLAKLYENGDILKKIDKNKSYEYHKLAAEKGHIISQMKLSELYFYGKFNKNKPDFYMSYFWMVSAATKGNGKAAYIVAEYVLTGHGIHKNNLLALWWFMISESYGYKDATLKLDDLKNWANKEDEGIFYNNKCCLFC